MKRQAIIEIWKDLNARTFGGVLTMPRILCTRNDREYASYVEPGIMYFTNKAIRKHWARSIVYHEMTHQYIAEFLGIYDEEGHGRLFWKHYRKFAPMNVILFEGL